MSCQLILKSFGIVGLRRSCTFKEYPVAVPAARAAFEAYKNELPGECNTELIVYAMSEEPVHPDRQESFAVGVMRMKPDRMQNGLEYIEIRDHWFTTVVYRGPIAGIGKGYSDIYEYIRAHKGREDKTSFVVELYDRRFHPDAEESEMEIYVPVVMEL